MVPIFSIHFFIIITINKPLTIVPGYSLTCEYTKFDDSYLDSTFIKVLNKEQRKLYSYSQAENLCTELGQACAGFVTESNSPSGLNYFPREKAVLISSSTDPKIRMRKFTPSSVLKICPGDVSQNFPYEKPVGSASYQSKFNLEMVIALTTSLIYKDTVLFEGLDTGIEHEWKIPIVANQTKDSVVEYENELRPIFDSIQLDLDWKNLTRRYTFLACETLGKH